MIAKPLCPCIQCATTKPPLAIPSLTALSVGISPCTKFLAWVTGRWRGLGRIPAVMASSCRISSIPSTQTAVSSPPCTAPLHLQGRLWWDENKLSVLSHTALLKSSFTAQKTIFCTGKYYRSFSVISLVGLSPTCLKKAKCDLLSDKKKKEEQCEAATRLIKHLGSRRGATWDGRCQRETTSISRVWWPKNQDLIRLQKPN